MAAERPTHEESDEPDPNSELQAAVDDVLRDVARRDVLGLPDLGQKARKQNDAQFVGPIAVPHPRLGLD